MSKEYTNSGVEVRYPIDAIKTSQARDIMDRIVPEWAEEFLRKNAKYRAVDNSLGPKGVFPDVWRKVGILKSRMWIGNESIGEPTREVIMDLVGHLLLMVHMMDAEALPPELDGDDELQEGQGWALDRAADRMSASAAQDRFTEEERLETEGERKRDHEYDHLMNCLYCGYAHVGPESLAYQTICPGVRRRRVSRSEMTVSERLELDGGRH